MSTGVCLRLFVAENRVHHHQPLYEWLLETGRGLGIPGGTAFRAIAGFGRRGTLHQDGFFELAGELPVAVDFIADEALVRSFLARLAEERLDLFYTLGTAEFGALGRHAP